ncbi:MAG: 4-alpha-glucanotransferase [Acidobacteriota bacterium]
MRALGTELDGPGDVERALAERRRARWRRHTDPVTVSRGGNGILRLRLARRDADARLRGEIVTEQGERRPWEAHLGDLEPLAGGDVDGAPFVVKHLPLPHDLPQGYHDGRFEIAGTGAKTLIIAAPPTRRPAAEAASNRGWGGFLPLYALRADDDWGVGDYRALATLGRRLAEYGADKVATLPLLPTDNEAPAPSPYSPLSRLFWNELYIDLSAVPEVRDCAAWRRLIDAPESRRRLAELRSTDLVRYAEIDRLKRSLLVEAAAGFFDAGDTQRRADFDRFVERRPEVKELARFRALRHAQGRPWNEWPARLRAGDVRDGDVDVAAYHAHLFAQWLAHRQLGEVADDLAALGTSLYLDLPLGVPHDSYDVWRYRDRFVDGVSAGAPPDTFFRHGQSWGLAPMHPERSREHGHDYLRACLRHHLSFAGTLRIDHVMALHRLFWVPEGFAADEGVYVRYPAAELWAVLALEAQRHDAVIVGEDLGTVPPAVRRSMRRNGARRIFVVQTEVVDDRTPCLATPSADSSACMNTHDMPPFAAWVRGDDLADLGELGFLDRQTVAEERTRRSAAHGALATLLQRGGWLPEADDAGAWRSDTYALLRACLRFLADSAAADVVVNLEDLWLEERPQNVPGTRHERDNWQRRARYTIDEMMALPQVSEALDEIAARRRGAPRGEA